MRTKLKKEIEQGGFENYKIEWTLQAYDQDRRKIEPSLLSDYQKALIQAVKLDLKHPKHSILIFSKPSQWTKEELETWFAQNLTNNQLFTLDLEEINQARVLYKSTFSILKLGLKIIILEKGKDKLIIYTLPALDPKMHLFQPDQLKIKLFSIENKEDYPIEINEEESYFAVKPNIKLHLKLDFKAAHSSRKNKIPLFSFKLANGELLTADSIENDEKDYIFTLTQEIFNENTSMKLIINGEPLKNQLDLFELEINDILCGENFKLKFTPFDKAIIIVDGNSNNLANIWSNQQKKAIKHCVYETEIDHKLTFPTHQDHPSNGHCIGISQYSASHHCWQPYKVDLKVIEPVGSGFFLRKSRLQTTEYQRYDLVCRGSLFEQAIIGDINQQLKIKLTHNIKKEEYTLVVDLGTSSLCVAVYNKNLKNPEILELQLDISNIGELIESDLNIYPTYVSFKPEELVVSEFFPIDFKPKITLKNQVNEQTLTNIKILMLIPSISFKVENDTPLNYQSYDVIKPANEYFIDKIKEALALIGKQYFINKIIFSIPNLGINENTREVYIEAFDNITKISGYTHLKNQEQAKLQRWAETSLFSESQSVLFYYYYKALKNKDKKQYIVFDIGAGTTDLTYAEVIQENEKPVLVTKCSICLPLAGSFIDYLMADAFINYLVIKDAQYQSKQAEPIVKNRARLDDKTIYPHEMKHYDKIFSRRLKDFIISLKYHYKSTNPEYQIPKLLQKASILNEFNTSLFDNIDEFYNEFENTPAYSALGNGPLLDQITKLTQGAIDNMIEVCQLKNKMNDLQIIISGRTSRFKLIQDILKNHYAKQIVFVSTDDSHEDKYSVVKGAAILADRQTRYRGLLKTQLIYPKLFLYKKDDFSEKGYTFMHMFDLNNQAEYKVTDSQAGQSTYHFFISYDARSYDSKTNTPDIETFINRVYVLERFQWENEQHDPILTFKIEKEDNTGVSRIHFKVYNKAEDAIIFNSEPILDEFFELGVKKGTVPWQTEGLFKQAMWPYYQDVIE